MTSIRIGKCPVCGIKVESDYDTAGCSEHREKVKTANNRRMEELRRKKAEKEESHAD
jgi:hypothetical protein